MRRATILLALVILLLPRSVGLAQDPVAPQQGYDLSWWTVDGGGGMHITGGDYTLGGTVGQADAQVITGGAYTLAGGFWGSVETAYHIYLPAVLRNF